MKREISALDNVVKIGASDHRVRRIQEWLQFHEFSTLIDELYGPATASAVGAFQAASGARRTGRVNNATWNILAEPYILMTQTVTGLKSLLTAESGQYSVWYEE